MNIFFFSPVNKVSRNTLLFGQNPYSILFHSAGEYSVEATANSESSVLVSWSLEGHRPEPDRLSTHISLVELGGDDEGEEPGHSLEFKGSDVQSPFTVDNLHKDRTYQVTVEFEDDSSKSKVLQRITLDVCTGEQD